MLARFRDRRFLLLPLILAMGCKDDPLRPANPDEIALYVEMPPQRLWIDRRGAHVQAEELRLAIESVNVETNGGAICVEGACVTSYPHVLTLRAGERRLWAVWKTADSDDVTIRITIRPFDSRQLPAGSSVVLGGIYNGILAGESEKYGAFVLGLAHVQEVVTSLPGNTKGHRLRLILDPGNWLYDVNADRILEIEPLVGRVRGVEEPVAKELMNRIKEKVIIESF